jgi:hypothetical protein
MMSGYKNSLKSLVDAEAQALGARLKTLKTREEQTALIVAETDPIRFFEDAGPAAASSLITSKKKARACNPN